MSVNSPAPPVSLRATLLGLVGVERLLGLLDQGEHVTHAEDAGGHPVGMERVEVVELLAVGGEHHLAPGDLGDRERRPTTGVTVELGEHDAVEPDAVEERLGGGDRVLADHRVDDEQDLVRGDGVPDVRRLLHQLVVDAEPARGVDDHDVVLLGPGVLDRLAGHRHRIAYPVAGLRCVHRHARTVADDLELLYRVRALQVGRDQQRGVVLPAQPGRQLARERGLTGALQAGEHDHGGRVLGEPQPPGLPAEDADELLVDDLDDLLGRVQRLRHLGAACPLLDRADERTHHRQGDVGLEQRHPDLPAGGVDVSVGEPALAAQVLERRCQAVGKSVEHVGRVPRRRRRGMTARVSGPGAWSRCASPTGGRRRVDGAGRRSAPASSPPGGYPGNRAPWFTGRLLRLPQAGLQGSGHLGRGVRGERVPVGADHVEGVHRLRAQGVDPGAAYVHARVGQRRADAVQQAGPVVRAHLEHGGLPGGAGDHVHPRWRYRVPRAGAARRPPAGRAVRPRSACRPARAAGRRAARPTSGRSPYAGATVQLCTAVGGTAVGVHRLGGGRPHGQPMQRQHAGHVASRPTRSGATTVSVAVCSPGTSSTAELRRQRASCVLGRGQGGRCGVRLPGQHRVGTRHQIVHQARPPAVPRRRAGGQRVRLGECVQQVEDLAGADRGRDRRRR